MTISHYVVVDPLRVHVHHALVVPVPWIPAKTGKIGYWLHPVKHKIAVIHISIYNRSWMQFDFQEKEEGSAYKKRTPKVPKEVNSAKKVQLSRRVTAESRQKKMQVTAPLKQLSALFFSPFTFMQHTLTHFHRYIPSLIFPRLLSLDRRSDNVRCVQ